MSETQTRFSQKDNVLRYLQSGYTLTPLEALQKFGSLRLSAIIFNLKRDGHDIQADINKEGKQYAIYRLRKNGELF